MIKATIFTGIVLTFFAPLLHAEGGVGFGDILNEEVSGQESGGGQYSEVTASQEQNTLGKRVDEISQNSTQNREDIIEICRARNERPDDFLTGVGDVADYFLGDPSPQCQNVLKNEESVETVTGIGYLPKENICQKCIEYTGNPRAHPSGARADVQKKQLQNYFRERKKKAAYDKAMQAFDKLESVGKEMGHLEHGIFAPSKLAYGNLTNNRANLRKEAFHCRKDSIVKMEESVLKHFSECEEDDIKEIYGKAFKRIWNECKDGESDSKYCDKPSLEPIFKAYGEVSGDLSKLMTQRKRDGKRLEEGMLKKISQSQGEEYSDRLSETLRESGALSAEEELTEESKSTYGNVLNESIPLFLAAASKAQDSDFDISEHPRVREKMANFLNLVKHDRVLNHFFESEDGRKTFTQSRDLTTERFQNVAKSFKNRLNAIQGDSGQREGSDKGIIDEQKAKRVFEKLENGESLKNSSESFNVSSAHLASVAARRKEKELRDKCNGIKEDIAKVCAFHKKVDDDSVDLTKSLGEMLRQDVKRGGEQPSEDVLMEYYRHACKLRDSPSGWRFTQDGVFVRVKDNDPESRSLDSLVEGMIGSSSDRSLDYSSIHFDPKARGRVDSQRPDDGLVDSYEEIVRESRERAKSSSSSVNEGRAPASPSQRDERQVAAEAEPGPSPASATRDRQARKSDEESFSGTNYSRNYDTQRDTPSPRDIRKPSKRASGESYSLPPRRQNLEKKKERLSELKDDLEKARQQKQKKQKVQQYEDEMASLREEIDSLREENENLEEDKADQTQNVGRESEETRTQRRAKRASTPNNNYDSSNQSASQGSTGPQDRLNRAVPEVRPTQSGAVEEKNSAQTEREREVFAGSSSSRESGGTEVSTGQGQGLRVRSATSGEALTLVDSSQLSTVSTVPGEALDLDFREERFQSVSEAIEYAKGNQKEQFVYKGILYEFREDKVIPLAKVEDGKRRELLTHGNEVQELSQLKEDPFVDIEEIFERFPAREPASRDRQRKSHDDLKDLIDKETEK